MITAESTIQSPVFEKKSRRCAKGDHPSVLTDIYQDDTNIVVWEREPNGELSRTVSELLQAQPTLKTSLTVSPQDSLASLSELLNEQHSTVLSEDIAELVDMFCFLFELNRVGLRLTALEHAMCPRFHVDRVPCRLVTTYQGTATEWLPHNVVDRSKLGHGNQGKPDEESGLFTNPSDIRCLTPGDVALLKGELWIGNENAGLVHRSPKVGELEQRLLLTLDFMAD
ncbi:MAG: DUF1826 domain-containing protein [Pseudomonadales bacterium]|nr:DUF1826 domain-containing protein [Pseudomonadales bacterium]